MHVSWELQPQCINIAEFIEIKIHHEIRKA